MHAVCGVTEPTETDMMIGWLVGCRCESNYSLLGHGTMGGMPSAGGFSKGS